jgi:hypothetical protein
MRRFPVVLPAMLAVAVVACNKKAPVGGEATVVVADSAVAPPPGGPITVNVSCDTLRGVGATIHPWRVHTGGATQLTWNIVPNAQDIPTTLDSVPGRPWAFQDAPYQSSGNSITAQIRSALIDSLRASAGPDGHYSFATYYRLTLVCPSGVTIVIDPEVIVDDTE